MGISPCTLGESPCSHERNNKEILPEARGAECRTKPSGEAVVLAWILDFPLASGVPFSWDVLWPRADWAEASPEIDRGVSHF